MEPLNLTLNVAYNTCIFHLGFNGVFFTAGILLLAVIKSDTTSTVQYCCTSAKISDLTPTRS